MFNAIIYTLIGIPTGYGISIFINDMYNRLYNTNISTTLKYNIIIIITFFAFLKGYTGNDLITNIYENF
jgi:choline-glycine betaine transporter